MHPAPSVQYALLNSANVAEEYLEHNWDSMQRTSCIASSAFLIQQSSYAKDVFPGCNRNERAQCRIVSVDLIETSLDNAGAGCLPPGQEVLKLDCRCSKEIELGRHL